MDILELKLGNIDVTDIDKYNKLNHQLTFWRKRLQCVQSSLFNSEYFKLGDYGNSSSYEDKHYLILSSNRSERDTKLKQEVIDFLTCRIIDNINDITRQLNELIK